MVVVDTAVDDANDDLMVTGGLVPGLGCVDVGVLDVVQRPVVGKVRIVRNRGLVIEIVGFDGIDAGQRGHGGDGASHFRSGLELQQEEPSRPSDCSNDGRADTVNQCVAVVGIDIVVEAHEDLAGDVHVRWLYLDAVNLIAAGRAGGGATKSVRFPSVDDDRRRTRVRGCGNPQWTAANEQAGDQEKQGEPGDGFPYSNYCQNGASDSAPVGSWYHLTRH